MLREMFENWKASKAIRNFNNNKEIIQAFNENALKYQMVMTPEGNFKIENKLTKVKAIVFNEKEFKSFVAPVAECKYMDELVLFMLEKMYTNGKMSSHDLYKKFLSLQEEWEQMAKSLLDKLRYTDHFQQVDDAYEWLEHYPDVEIELNAKLIYQAQDEMGEAFENYNQKEYREAEFNLMQAVFLEELKLINKVKKLQTEGGF